MDLHSAPAPHRPALDGLTALLACPHCAATPLARDGRSLRCPIGHSFDIARHGYVSLLRGDRRHRHLGDDPAMVAARDRFLSAGHYRPLVSTVTAFAVEHAGPAEPVVLDLAAGTGHHLAAVVDAVPGARGLAVDLSGAALRRAARVHPRVAAVAADVWRELPVAPGSAQVVLTVFGPRNAAEIERVLDRRGVLVVAGAAPDHLHELRDLLGTLGVDPHAPARRRAAFAAFEPVARQPVTWRMALHPEDVRSLVAMGPSARHLDPAELDRAVAALPATVGVTAAIEVLAMRPRSGG
ncbi:putative RNA methyltransferase [Pseudonocardia sp. HH130630-07]|uniref:putative RNA methyltransferase n=1 Tax=Pseudonocardia sp. HH130630-07 TaxID=1690815 RepID=UPI0008151CA7|nr:methyltransferase domain-containing protein [Pseudonocardia sp. HH130630-07]ANY07715.1 hypothetical protein AFB00_17045 [Pseudonocardia sp. HH130630-07]